MRNIRLTMLGLLCAGLVLCGVGAGVAFSEFSAFTYAGEQMIEGAQSRTQSLTVELESASGPVYLSDYFYDAPVRLADAARLEVSGDVPAGTMRWDLSYESAGPEAVFWTEVEDHYEWVRLSWRRYDEASLFLACKDQVLSDVRRHQIGRYLPVRLTEAVVTVNPADAERVRFH